MATIPHHCQNCGGQFGFDLAQATFDCPACGMTHARPANAASGAYSSLSFANQERAAGRFREAEAAYTAVLSTEPDNHEARWGRMLCRYGVEFIPDPATKEERAIIHHASPVRTPCRRTSIIRRPASMRRNGCACSMKPRRPTSTASGKT